VLKFNAAVDDKAFHPVADESRIQSMFATR
jgi:hypothetical protein